MKYKFLILLALSVHLVGCSKKTELKYTIASDPIIKTLEIPNTTVELSELHYNKQTSRWTLNDQLFSGHAVSFYQDSILKEKINLLNGKKQNQSTIWYPDGHFKQVAMYHKGKLHGEKKKWTSDSRHILISHLHYYLGKAHGEQKIWYPTGELYKKLQLKMGKEEGIQKAYRKNGALYSNYEAKEGRIFGLKKAALCFGLDDETIQYEN